MIARPIVILILITFDSGNLDDLGQVLSLVVVHLEEHLLAFATVWLVVVDEQVAQDPLVQLQPRLQAAAKLAPAVSAALRIVSFRFLLIRVERLTVLALLLADLRGLAYNIRDDLVLGEEECLH